VYMLKLTLDAIFSSFRHKRMHKCSHSCMTKKISSWCREP
jgi:hypothetical protein